MMAPFDPDADFIEGYRDGRDLNSPEPSTNRSHAYRHSWNVGRAEKEGRWLGDYQSVLAAADEALAKDLAMRPKAVSHRSDRP